jgi:hypothetical protein
VPLGLTAEKRKNVDRFHLWVSEDQGKSWNRRDEIKSTGDGFPIVAPKDGHYWLVLQTASKDGRLLPPKVDGTIAVGLKIYVNAAGRRVIRKKDAPVQERSD